MLKKVALGAAAALATLAVAAPAFASDGNGGLIANRTTPRLRATATED